MQQMKVFKISLIMHHYPCEGSILCLSVTMFLPYHVFHFQVKAQYNMLMDSVKQISLQNVQGELDSHMETLSVQVRAHQAQQALSLHKVDMEASVMEVSYCICCF